MAATQVGVVRFAAISVEPLNADQIAARVEHPRAGAVVTFVGAVRNHDGGREVSSLTYESHPSAGEEMDRVASEFDGWPGVHAVAAVHRVGDLEIGDAALVVTVAAEHRKQAFECASELVDRIKAQVPIWKHQFYVDGTSDWSGCP